MDSNDHTMSNLLVEQAPDAIIYADLDGLIRAWNAAAERIFGHAATAAFPGCPRH